MRRDVKAVIMAEIGVRGYREFPVQNVQSYMVDGAMDTDSDSFSVDIGDPFNDLRMCCNRDTEVRVAIYTGPSDEQANVTALHWGVADTVQMSSDEHILSIEGRDYTSLAVDSHHPPGQWNNIRPHVFVTRDAKKLSIPELRLAHVPAIGKFLTEGDETYWEAWYRMYRKKKKWVWAEPDGTLVADALAYYSPPRYFFGKPKDLSQARDYIPVESAVLVSNKMRPGEVWVFGERERAEGQEPVGFVGKATDPTIASWKRKPLKIMQATKAENKKDAKKEAMEELFEGKVGAIEIILAVPDPGFVIEQNEMAVVRIPEIDLQGHFFVVGNQLTGGPDGYRQNVRLREKNFAISRRIPIDPELRKDPGDQKIVGGSTSLPSNINVRWGNFFAAAAKEFHGGWDMVQFLGVLLAICKHETSFRNVRGGLDDGDGDKEWYPMPKFAGRKREHSDDPPSGNVNLTVERQLWRSRFANAQRNPLNPRYPKSECAVGPMQLVTPGYKVWADEYGGRSDEYSGGRWKPEANIRAGARAFAAKLAGLNPKVAGNIWIGVEGYYGSKNQADNARYRNAIKALYENIYKAIAEGAIDEAPASGKTVGLEDTNDLRAIPRAYAQRGSCGLNGWPVVHPEVYNLAVAICRRFPVKIASGYRSKACNASVHGASKSDHLCGAGVDYVGTEASLTLLANWAVKQGYALVIYGPTKTGPADSWDSHDDHVHISFFRCD